MRVVHIVSTSPHDAKAGGVEKFTRDLLPTLMDFGISPVLLGIERGRSRGDCSAVDPYEFHPLLDLTAHVKRHEPKHISADADKRRSVRFLALRFYTAALLKSHKWIKRGDIIHVHRLEQLIPLLIIDNRKVLTLHSNVGLDIKIRRGRLVSKIYIMLEQIAAGRLESFGVKKIIFVSERLRREFTERYPNCSRISHVIRTGIEQNLYTPFNPAERTKLRQNYGYTEHDRIVLSIGRLTKTKNIDLIIKAFHELKKDGTSCRLLIGGSGEMKDELERMVKQLELEDVVFLGHIQQDKIRDYYGMADVFVIASTYEGGPITMYEALACGCPVLSTDVGTVPELIEEGITGRIVKSFTPADIAAGIRDIIGNRDKYRINVINRRYDLSIQSIARRYYEVYSDIAPLSE